MPIQKQCGYCKKTFHVKPSKALRGPTHGRFCSKPCFDKSRSHGHVTAACECCGNAYQIAARYAKETRFCSRECRYKKFPVVCARCGVTFYVVRSALGKRIYCNFKCYRPCETLTVVCAECGKVKTFLKHLASDNPTFCSPECSRPSHALKVRGPRNPAWKGGVTELRKRVQNSKEYQRWRTSVFTRDDFTCQECGDRVGGNLQAHHIKFLTTHPELMFDVDNGRTLCKSCHVDLHARVGRDKKPNRLKEYLLSIGWDLGAQGAGA